MCIPIVTFNFPDTYEHAKNQSNSFIHSWDTADYRVPLNLKATTIFEHAHLITIKVTFSFPEYVLACKKSARFIHSFRDLIPMPIFDHNQPKIIKGILSFPFLASLITDY